MVNIFAHFGINSIMNSFDQMATILSTGPMFDTVLKPKSLTSKEQYNEWLNTFFIFDKLKGLSLAESFIEHFKSDDFILGLAISDEMAKNYIENNLIK